MTIVKIVAIATMMIIIMMMAVMVLFELGRWSCYVTFFVVHVCNATSTFVLASTTCLVRSQSTSPDLPSFSLIVSGLGFCSTNVAKSLKIPNAVI